MLRALLTRFQSVPNRVAPPAPNEMNGTTLKDLVPPSGLVRAPDSSNNGETETASESESRFMVVEDGALEPTAPIDKTFLLLMGPFTSCEAFTLPSGAGVEDPDDGWVWRSDTKMIRLEPIVKK